MESHHHNHLHRKRKPRNLKLHIPISPNPSNLLLFLISLFLLLCFIFLTRFPSGSQSFRPILTISRFHPLSIQDSSTGSLPPLKIEQQISFPDHVLLLVSKIHDPSLMNSYRIGLECVHRFVENPTRLVVLPVLSVEDYDGWRSIVRCPVSSNTNKKSPVFVALRRRGGSTGAEEEDRLFRHRESMHSWEELVYNGVIDGETAVVFVKGLNLRPDRASDAAQFKCHFGWSNNFNALTTSAVTAAQEIVRCSLPRSFRNLPEKADGVGITISTVAHHGKHHNNEGEGLVHYVPSVARLSNLSDKRRRRKNKKYELCVCTMLWNQASSLKEWIQYHAWLGVERWFIYDNNSDDGIKEVVEQLEQGNYNVSIHTWPWIKTQEAGFSHCALRAKSECKWVGFIDVDEFFYFPIPSAPNRKTSEFRVYPGRNSLQSLITNVSHSAAIGEIRTSCHSFGPSGLNKHPSQGVTLGYTCRLQSPERHKSIVLLDALDETLLTVVHHFHLKKEFTYMNLPESTALINHYKYQVWEKFRAKFFRRVATYVADWQENQNEGSKDRAPGLGTEAIEPPNWSHQFCEVWDTGLRDFLIANLADPSSGLLPWESHDSQ
ncbi:hypothetical protein Scep_021613 [Stephania cephalantha]|uniref:Glycosyltransferase family 92 protein n=1 Tax=Stephania cephalantha TaxID=152367 RepID=A0AAP0FE91_9MAGN